ncbi:MAG: replication-associated recombination protein A [Bacteroidaceae bacterium]|nr:replication-associated recombination protein A [Bacteroidaceae bacterium]
MPPLAERLRPQTLSEYIGQKHLVGEGAVIQRMISQKRISSFILWGPPGVGKTTLANIIAKTLEVPFYTLSAVTSGVKDVREVIERARANTGLFSKGTPILFIDEIHRFSKSQQDSLLGAVEKGIITLIGATTENPSFEVIRPLLSRCQVYVLKSLGKEDLMELLDRALTQDKILKEKHIELKETGALLRLSGGDARKLLNILELVVEAASAKTQATDNQDSAEGNTAAGDIVITDDLVNESVLQNPLAYDKDGEMHYDVISAFIKSIRGSDPDAAVYYLARMIEAGEDPLFIARRLVISASEDIGLANPNALLLANACFDAVSKIGMPEGRIPLAETTVYLASSPKSNSSYLAIDSALAYVRQTGNLPVPLPIRNAPTSLMKELGYHDGYLYAHDYPDHFVQMQFLPDEAKDQRFWHPQPHTTSEARLLDRMLKCWGERYAEL